jgi:cation diffusion facilitator family transporter
MIRAVFQVAPVPMGHYPDLRATTERDGFMAGSSRKVIVVALLGNSLIAVTKFIAAAATGSAAMLSEAIHSLVDTGNQILLLHGLKQAGQAPSAQHPYGRGKEIYFWGFVVAISIFAVGAGVSIFEGVRRCLHPHPVSNPLIAYVVLGLAMIFEGAAWLFALREFRAIKGQRGYFEAVRENKDPGLFVVLFEDSAAMLGLMVALVGVFLTQITGWLYWDGIASILIGLILAGTAVWLAAETKSLLIGESALPEVVSGIRELAASFADIDHVNEVLTNHFGPYYILVNLSVDFRNEATAGDAERTIAALAEQIKDRFPDVRKVFVEVEARGATPPPGQEQ